MQTCSTTSQGARRVPLISLAVLGLVGCVAPATPPQTFLGPAFDASSASGDVSIIGGGDALLAGSARITRPAGKRFDMDLGLAGGYSYVGGEAGLWFRSKTRENVFGKKANKRVRLGIAMGSGISTSSELFNEGSATSVLEMDTLHNMYGGLSLHNQYNIKRGKRDGTLSIITGSGVTFPMHVKARSEAANFYFDFGVRVDKPSSLFYGVGLQMLPFNAGPDYPVPFLPVATVGNRF